MIVFAHTKFGLVRIKGSGVKRGTDFAPQPERVFEIPAWIELSYHITIIKLKTRKVWQRMYVIKS